MTRILIVEDDSHLRDHLGQFFESQGYFVATAANSDAACKALESVGADLMIVDVFLPGKNGLELMLEVRRGHPGMKFIVTSGQEHLLYGHSVKFALSLGANQALSKPFTNERLMQCVRSVLN